MTCRMDVRVCFRVRSAGQGSMISGSYMVSFSASSRKSCRKFPKTFRNRVFPNFSSFLPVDTKGREREEFSTAARPSRAPALDLRAFLLRVQALRLVRSAFRSARRAPPSAREELERTIRAEVERNRDVEDPQSIRFLLSEGRQRLKELNTMLGIQGHN